MKISKTIAVILLTALYSATGMIQTNAQPRYTDATELTLVGKAFPEYTEHPYFRVDTAKYNTMPKSVKNLFTNNAGIAVSFITNSSYIAAKWTVRNLQTGTNMTGMLLQGLDLYIKRDGAWVYAGTRGTRNKNSSGTLVSDMDRSEKECLLYLPCYGEVESLEIGVEPNASIAAGKNPFKGKYIVYGSSITQGASASRSGLAYPAALSRSSGYNFVNMGLSGNGKMEKEVGQMLADIKDVDAFILDCIANPTPEQINERARTFVTVIREKYPDVPIVFIQSVVREGGNFNLKVRENCRRQNEVIALEVKKMKDDGFRNIHIVMEDDFLGTDHEGTVDGTHPNDVGFRCFLTKIRKPLGKVLKIKL